MNKKLVSILVIALSLVFTACVKDEATDYGNLTSVRSSDETATMPSENYIGTWHTDDNPPDDLTILEINDTIKFELYIFRLVGTTGAAKIENDKIAFDTDANFRGTMQFNDNSILITVDESDFIYISAGTMWNFTLKDTAADEVSIANVMERIAGTWDWPSQRGNAIYVYPDGTWYHESDDHEVRGIIKLTQDGENFSIEIVATEGNGSGIEGSFNPETGVFDWIPHPNPNKRSYSGTYSVDYDRLIIQNRWDDSVHEMERNRQE